MGGEQRSASRPRYPEDQSTCGNDRLVAKTHEQREIGAALYEPLFNSLRETKCRYNSSGMLNYLEIED